MKFRKELVFGTYHFVAGFSSVVAGLIWLPVGQFFPEVSFIRGTFASVIAYLIINRYF